MTFSQFCAQVVEDLGATMSEDLPVLIARLNQETTAVDLTKRGSFEALEQQMALATNEDVYRIMSEWMVRTAASAPEICPGCDQALESLQREVRREVTLQTGVVTLRRSVGWCRTCAKWRCPTDVALKLNEITQTEAGCDGQSS